MDFVKMDFEKVDPWLWEKKFHQILNSLNIGPWGLRLLLWTYSKWTLRKWIHGSEKKKFTKFSTPSILVRWAWDCFYGLSQNGLWESGSMVVRNIFSPNSQLPQYWSVGSEIASMDLVKMDFEKVDPWLWEKFLHQILNSLNIAPWRLRLLLWTCLLYTSPSPRD